MILHKGLMSISDFAAYCGSTRQTMQYYDRIGLLRPLQTGGQGYRYYHPLQGHEMRLIHSLQRSGCSLEEIKDILNSQDIETLKDRFEEKRAALELEQQRIRREQLYLERFFQFVYWSANLEPNTPALYHFDYFTNLSEVVQVEQCEPFTSNYYDMVLQYAEYCRKNHTVQLYPYALYVDPEELAGGLRFSKVFALTDDTCSGSEHTVTATPGTYLCLRSYPDPRQDIRPGAYETLRRYMDEHGLRSHDGSMEIPFCIPRGLRRGEHHFTVIFILPVEEETGAGGEGA